MKLLRTKVEVWLDWDIPELRRAHRSKRQDRILADIYAWLARLPRVDPMVAARPPVSREFDWKSPADEQAESEARVLFGGEK